MLVPVFTTAVANEVVQKVIENDKRPNEEEGVHGSCLVIQTNLSVIYFFVT